MNKLEIQSYVISRAGNCCEYCRQQLAGQGFQIEHIVPRDSGGPDSIDNYAAACTYCNNRKGKETSGTDPLWLTVERLFNPRTDEHADHFVRNGTVWRGKTAIGRVTANLLFRATPQFIPDDQSWPFIQPLKASNPALYWVMNTLRARTKLNDYSLLKKNLHADPSFIAAAPDAKAVAIEAITLLKITLQMLRAEPGDIDLGLKALRRLRRATTKRPLLSGELYGIESIFLKQMATAIALRGNIARSIKLQQVASKQLLHAIRLRNEDLTKDEWSSRRFRLMALENRFARPQKPQFASTDVASAVSRAVDSIFPDALLQLTDVELTSRNPTRHADAIMNGIERSLETIGYQQDIDYGVGLAVRRRWWELQIHLGIPIRSDLLQADLNYWRKIGMCNEVRGLQLTSWRNADAREMIGAMI